MFYDTWARSSSVFLDEKQKQKKAKIKYNDFEQQLVEKEKLKNKYNFKINF